MNTKSLPKRMLDMGEIRELANRLTARANSPLLKDQPQQQNDMRQAAEVLSWLAQGDKAEQPFASMPVV